MELVFDYDAPQYVTDGVIIRPWKAWAWQSVAELTGVTITCLPERSSMFKERWLVSGKTGDMTRFYDRLLANGYTPLATF